MDCNIHRGGCCDFEGERQSFRRIIFYALSPKFAGENPELAKYYPEDDEFLLEKEEYVQHYRIFYEK